METIITPDDLRPGDEILSYKKPVWYNIFQHFFDWILVLKAKKKYGRYCVFARCNHVRVYIGYDTSNDSHKVFEWTYPEAKESYLENWMLSPEYSRIYRYTGGIDKSILEDIDELFFDALEYIEYRMFKEGEHNWRKYDWGQLLDIAVGWKRVFDLGKNRRVCSSGARYLVEEAFAKKIMKDTPLNKTLPCAFANDSEFTCVNTTVDTTGDIKPEPTD